MRVRLIDPFAPQWSGELDRIGLLLRTHGDAALFPYHFLQVTLPRIGGGAAWVDDAAGHPIGAAFYFPRQRDRGGAHVYTLRYHALPGAPIPAFDLVGEAASAALGGQGVFVYNTAAPQAYAPTHQQIGSVDIGRPDAAEAAAVPALHAAIWGSPPEFIYPADLHSINFAAATSLVARVAGDGSAGDSSRCVGFLAGFAKFGGPRLPADWDARFGGDFRIESQVMGVLPAYRGLRIANLLKKVQAEQAWREGIGIINWTADPLQYPNAALNFGLLRAVAFDFAPDLYPFRNQLNRVAASRFGVTWLVGSARVREAPMVGGRANVLDLTHHPAIPRIDVGAHATAEPSAPLIAIEIPADWTALQNEDVQSAIAWRAATDALFARIIGTDAGHYVITNVGIDSARRYLLAERAGAALWAQLGRT